MVHNFIAAAVDDFFSHFRRENGENTFEKFEGKKHGKVLEKLVKTSIVDKHRVSSK